MTYTPDLKSDTLEEEMQLPKYHHENAIYLYCTMERTTANQIIQTDSYPAPLCLYETPDISRAMAVNLREPVVLRVAVDLRLSTNEYYYDQLTMTDSKIKEKFKVKNIEDYKKRCVYTRCLVTSPKAKTQQIIQYTVYNAKKLYINPQYIG